MVMHELVTEHCVQGVDLVAKTIETFFAQLRHCYFQNLTFKIPEFYPLLFFFFGNIASIA